MKKISLSIIITVCLLLMIGACVSEHNEKDMVPPTIEDSEDCYPQQCQSFFRGEVIPVRCLFADDNELGNYNIEVHNNFDHHTHSTVAGECEMEEKKSPVNPWVYNKDYHIPEGQTAYQANLEIPIPTDIDTGNYHFVIRLTDATGWQQIKSVSISIK